MANDALREMMELTQRRLGIDPQTTIGLEREIRQQFAGERIYIGSDKDGRNEDMRRLYRGGSSVKELAAMYGMTVRNVELIVKR